MMSTVKPNMRKKYIAAQKSPVYDNVYNNGLKFRLCWRIACDQFTANANLPAPSSEIDQCLLLLELKQDYKITIKLI